jgi:hypothetical protein
MPCVKTIGIYLHYLYSIVYRYSHRDGNRRL